MISFLFCNLDENASAYCPRSPTTTQLLDIYEIDWIRGMFEGVMVNMESGARGVVPAMSAMFWSIVYI